MRQFVVAMLSTLVGVSGCGGQHLLVYRVDNPSIFVAQFVDTHDTLLVHQSNGRFRDELRFFSADGELISQGEVAGYWPSTWFLLADQYHLVVPSGQPGDGRYTLAPETSAPSPTAQAVLAWLADARGLLIEGERPSAATNPYADLSCAVGADGSFATWSTSTGGFRSSRPGLIGERQVVNAGVWCLRHGDEDFLVTVSINPGSSSARIFSARSQELVVKLALTYEGRSTIPQDALHVAPDVIGWVSQAPILDVDPALRPFIATRISGASGQWVAESARLNEDWPAIQRIRSWSVERDSILLSLEGTSHAVRVPWPSAATELPFAPQMVASPEDEFRAAVLRSNTPRVSPSGTHVLWLDHDGELRVERADQIDARR